MSIIICGLPDVPSLIAQRRPSHLVTLLDAHTMIATPPDIAPDRHLKLGINDVTAPAEGLIPPDESTVQALLDFTDGWDEARPILIHCWAGISRSTASAFVLACRRDPHTPELTIALAMRRAAAHASPNRRIIAIADDMLGRRGRMVDAVAAMGDYDQFSARPFEIPVRQE